MKLVVEAVLGPVLMSARGGVQMAGVLDVDIDHVAIRYHNHTASREPEVMSRNVHMSGLRTMERTTPWFLPHLPCCEASSQVDYRTVPAH